MLARLKKLFGSGDATTARPRRARVNLKRRYTILAQTSQGSMSKVYKAIDKEAGRTVCLKVQLKEKNEAAAARAARDGRPDEGDMAIQIVHPNVIRTLDWGVSTDGEQFVVMEFFDGNSLQFIRETGAAPRLSQKLEILAQAAEALAAVHAAGFVHHDINPGNFLVDRDQNVKLIDFGLAVPNTPAFHRPGNRTGTLNYMAPELLRRETTDERLDIFAFGAVAFEFLTGRLPYDGAGSLGAMIQRLNTDPIDPARVNPDLPPELHALLRKLIARNPKDRWPRMETLPQALRAIGEATPTTSRRGGAADDRRVS